MNPRLFHALIALAGLGFALAFALTVLPPLLEDGDLLGAFAAGFVNPYASGYALDAIFCWVILLLWVIHERLRYRVQHGWLAVLLGVAPGVATGLAVYLLLRRQQRDKLRERA